MSTISLLALVIMLAGDVWFSWEVFQREDVLWALLVFFIPFPLIGLYIWYRAGWDSCYRKPAIVYFAGYLLVFLIGKLA
jgi:hypothetical protein